MFFKKNWLIQLWGLSPKSCRVSWQSEDPGKSQRSSSSLKASILSSSGEPNLFLRYSVDWMSTAPTNPHSASASLGLRWLRICLQCRRCGFNPWVGKISWRRKWQPTPVFLPGKSYGQTSLAGCNPWGRKELDTADQLSLHPPNCGKYLALC